MLLAMLKSLTPALLILSSVLSCQNPQSGKPSAPDSHVQSADWKLTNPQNDDVYTFSDTLNFQLSAGRAGLHIDSVQLFLAGGMVHTPISPDSAFESNGLFEKAGRQTLRIRIHYNDSLAQALSVRLTVLAEEPPKQLVYKIVGEFPHDPSSFTQGYFYHDGYLYEGTGRLKHSRLLKIDPTNGKIVQQREMDDDIFGEGITLMNGMIYQLTYQNKVGFVYDLETFELIRTFDLQTFEGWGLTNNGSELIVSDGSSILYFYDPEYLNQTRQLDVSTDQRLITSLNELEYVQGAIWANVYGDQYIVKIDSRTGIVMAECDLSGLFPESVPRDYSHVLNGIAYNPDRNTFYVTGKLWPVTYEISIIE